MCVQARNFSASRLNNSTQRAINALSKVNDAFKQALQNARPPAPPVDAVIAFVTQTAKEVLDEKLKTTLDSKGWSGRKDLHEEVVNKTIDKLKNYTRLFTTT